MKLDEKTIRQVLALFDEEDIQYINFEYLFNKYFKEDDAKNTKSNTNVKTKKLERKKIKQENNIKRRLKWNLIK